MKIAPSILSANFAHLQEDVDKIKNADILHIDVMDGHFVPNITIGPVVIKDIKTDLLKEAHLMIKEPEKYAEPFIKAGVQRIIFHAETVKNAEELIDLIKSHGVARDGRWSESIAVGSEQFIEQTRKSMASMAKGRAIREVGDGFELR